MPGTEKADSLPDVLSKSGKQGKQIHEIPCTACRGPDEYGVQQGDRFSAPPLGTPGWSKRGGDVVTLGRILLNGRSGPNGGVNCGEGLMFPHEPIDSDGQFASVLRLPGQRRHQSHGRIGDAAIARVRNEVAARATPCRGGDITALGKPGAGE